MAKLTLQTLGRKLADKRGAAGIRETAKSIGVSPATLSRVERGHMPDLETFGKICRWLGVDPGDVLGTTPTGSPGTPPLLPKVGVHFRKDQTLKPETAQALAQMILAAQRALMASGSSEEIR
jgi:transcriptional regulator with XRE-family HTH domain